MGFDKTVNARLWGVTTQASELRTVTGDSTGGTFTNRVNPLRGSLFWDRGMYVLQNVAIAGGATGGSFTVTIETDAVAGQTGLPIARASGLGPNSATTIIMDSLHQSPATPLPTHMFIDEVAGGGGITLTCDVIAKQYRGTLGTPGAGTSERILQGTVVRGVSATGTQFVSGTGFNASETVAMSGVSASDLGMGRMRLWDNAMFWAVAGVSVDGGYDIDMISSVGGNTVSVASTGTGGLLTGVSRAIRVAIANNFYGQCPNPTAMIWTETSAGDGISDMRIVGIAKSGRGSMAKR